MTDKVLSIEPDVGKVLRFEPDVDKVLRAFTWSGDRINLKEKDQDNFSHFNYFSDEDDSANIQKNQEKLRFVTRYSDESFAYSSDSEPDSYFSDDEILRDGFHKL